MKKTTISFKTAKQEQKANPNAKFGKMIVTLTNDSYKDERTFMYRDILGYENKPQYHNLITWLMLNGFTQLYNGFFPNTFNPDTFTKKLPNGTELQVKFFNNEMIYFGVYTEFNPNPEYSNGKVYGNLYRLSDLQDIAVKNAAEQELTEEERELKKQYDFIFAIFQVYQSQAFADYMEDYFNKSKVKI